MDATTFTSPVGAPTTPAAFLNTIRMFQRTAWNAYPNKHYYGMISVEQVDGGWLVGISPTGAGDRVNEAFYATADEERIAMEVGRKMHPTLICTCAGACACFAEGCSVKP